MALIQLRKIQLKDDHIGLRIGGKVIDAKVRPLSAKCEKAIHSTLLYIKMHYRPEVFGIPLDSVLGAARFVCFLQTDTPGVGAYANCDQQMPLIIIDQGLLRSKDPAAKKEVAVTLLHELIHFMHKESADKASTGEFEGEFDLLCYEALGFMPPEDHWARKKSG